MKDKTNMSETTANQEQTAVRAAEVLVTSEELEAMVYGAVDEGVIDIQPAEPGVETKPDLYVSIKASRDELKLKDGKNFLRDGSGYFEPGDFEWVNGEAIAREAITVRDRVAYRLYAEVAPWYTKDDSIDEIVESGGVLQQWHEFTVGDKKLDLLNLSQTESLSEEQVGEIRDTIDRFANTNGLGSLKYTQGIVIVPHETLNQGRKEVEGSAIGLHKNINGIVFISDALLRPGAAPEKDYGTEEHLSRLKSTLAHELGHSAQLYGWDTYRKALNWETSSYEAVDDYGNHKKGKRELRGKPAQEQEVFVDGHYVNVDTIKHFGSWALNSAEPNTIYAKTNANEDFAEAIVPYVFGGRSTALIDPIRRNAIAKTLHDRATEDVMPGPYVVQVTEKNLTTCKKELPVIAPRVFKVKINAQVEADNQTDYEYRRVINDYGEEQTVRLQLPSKN